jgi:hypothetical protein
LDEALRHLLEQEDWEDIVGKLTLAALHQLKVCGWTQDAHATRVNPAAKDAKDYAIDAMVKAYEACETGKNKWDPTRGHLFPFLERLVRRLITDDKSKYSKGPAITPIEDEIIEPQQEKRMEDLLIDMVVRSDEKMAAFISAVLRNAETDGQNMRWNELREELCLTRHACDQMRRELADLIDTCIKDHPLPDLLRAAYG